MKKLILLLVTFALVSFESIKATNNYNNTNGQSFTFNESGIAFSIFQNGEFDFYLNQVNGVNVHYQTNNVNISFNAGYNYDPYVQYDNFGAIIQIQNTPVYYDYYGRVSQVGNIQIKYYNGNVVRLGSMQVYYNSYGQYSYYRGYINVYNRHYVYHPYHNYFARPHYDYRVVSYKPYRHHYKAHRYAYHRDHSRNKYYKKNSKHYKSESRNKYDNKQGHSSSKRQRVATNTIPKRNNDYAVTTSRRSATSAADLFKNDESNYKRAINSTSKRTTSVSTGRDNSKPRSTVYNKPKTIDRSSAYKKPTQSRSSSKTSEKYATTQHKSVTATTRKPSTTQSRSKTTTRKPSSRSSSIITTERKPVKREEVKRRSVN